MSSMTDIVEHVHILFGSGLCMSEFNKKKMNKMGCTNTLCACSGICEWGYCSCLKSHKENRVGKNWGCYVLSLFYFYWNNLFVPLLTLWHKCFDKVYVMQMLLSRTPWYVECYSFLWHCGKTRMILSGSVLCWKL